MAATRLYGREATPSLPCYLHVQNGRATHYCQESHKPNAGCEQRPGLLVRWQTATQHRKYTGLLHGTVSHTAPHIHRPPTWYRQPHGTTYTHASYMGLITSTTYTQASYMVLITSTTYTQASYMVLLATQHHMYTGLLHGTDNHTAPHIHRPPTWYC